MCERDGGKITVIATHPDRGVTYIALLLERVGQVAVGIGEVWLQLDGAAVRVDGQVDQTLLVIHARQVAMHHCMVGAQAQSSQVASHRSEQARERGTNNEDTF